jgi:hypothetical protein
LSGSGKRTTKHFSRTKVYVVSLILSLVFKTVFRIFLSTSGLSQICKIRNAWKLPFYRNTPRKIPKTVLKITLKAKEITYTLVFEKYFDVPFRSHSIRAFSVFLEDISNIISGT